MVRWSWVNFQCRGVLLVWIRVGQGPTALAVGAGGGCLDIFTLIYPFSCLSPSLWETTRYRLEYCLKGSLSPKTTNQPKCPVFMIITVMINLMRQIRCMKSVNGRFDHSKGGSIYLFFAKMICARQTVRMTATSDLLSIPV